MSQSVYVIGFRDGTVKFGRSSDIKHRHQVINCREGRGRGRPIEVFQTELLPDGEANSIEAALKRRFKDARVAGHWELIEVAFDDVVEALDAIRLSSERNRSRGRYLKDVQRRVVQPLRIAELIANGQRDLADRLTEMWRA